MKRFSTFLCFLIALASSAIYAQGGLDQTFASTGKIVRSLTAGYDFASATAVQSDGKILVAGYTSSTNADIVLLRFNTNGSLDTAFGDSGNVTTDFGKSEVATAMVIQPNGKIILAGQTNPVNNADFALVRYNTDGSIDTTFGHNGLTTAAIGQYDDIAQAVTLQSDGRIVVAGYSGAYPNYDFSAARFLSNGTIDSSFSSDGRVVMSIGSGIDMAMAVKIQANGKIVIAGKTVASAAYDIAVVRLLADGSLDLNFGSTGIARTSIGIADDMGSALEIQADQKILVGGTANTGSYNDFAVVRYDTSGNLDHNFNGDGKQTVAIGNENDGAASMALQSDGSIVLGGYAKVGMYNQFALARVDKNGKIDSTFGHHGRTSFALGTNNDMILSIALQSDGKIIAAGVSSNGANYDIALVRYIPGIETGIHTLSATPVTASAYPNPASWEVNLFYYLPQNGESGIELLDLQGKVVYTVLSQTFQKAGLQTHSFTLPDSLPAGMYFISITSSSGSAVLKLLKE